MGPCDTVALWVPLQAITCILQVLITNSRLVKYKK